MRRFSIYMIGLILILSGLIACSVEHHLQKRDHHTLKAKEKGAIFAPDTIWQYKIEYQDSLIYLDGDTIRVPYPVIDSIPYPVDELIYVPLSRQERLHLRDSMRFAHKGLKIELKRFKVLADMYQDSLKHERKINRQNNRTERTQFRQENKGSGWLIWLIVGIAIGVILTLLISKRNPMLKKLLSSYLNS